MGAGAIHAPEAKGDLNLLGDRKPGPLEVLSTTSPRCKQTVELRQIRLTPDERGVRKPVTPVLLLSPLKDVALALHYCKERATVWLAVGSSRLTL